MGVVLLTITTTHEPATDLGYLLVKHPDRVQQFGVTNGTAHVFFPEATPERCTAALLLDIDLDVGDRAYAASSLMSVALGKVWRTALKGESPDRPELARTPIPLTLRIPALSCRGGPSLVRALFEPLGWTVTATENRAGRDASGVGREPVHRPDPPRPTAALGGIEPAVRAAAGAR